MIYAAFAIEALIIAWLVFSYIRTVTAMEKQSGRIDALIEAFQAARGEVVATPELIATWKSKMAACDFGSPKFHAYRARLIEIGAMKDEY